ncbi:MAG: hypothetical protein IKZ19_02640, partial [Clostridia bacterium]|nr:hypothetical protein [Clostridia bacterium]
MKRLTLLPLLMAVCILFSCCGKPGFEDPQKQACYEKIVSCIDNRDFENLTVDTDWYVMRQEDAVKKYAAKKLTEYMKEDDLDSACQLLTSMPFDFIDGNEYYASYDFTGWILNRFSNEGQRFIKEEGLGGYYDTNSHELVEFVNYDELNDVEYVSKVWFSGDFALNIYTSRIRTTGELVADHSVGLYVAGTCIAIFNDNTETINGDALLKGYCAKGSYYTLNGYIISNPLSSCLDGFTLTNAADGGYGYVET